MHNLEHLKQRRFVPLMVMALVKINCLQIQVACIRADFRPDRYWAGILQRGQVESSTNQIPVGYACSKMDLAFSKQVDDMEDKQHWHTYEFFRKLAFFWRRSQSLY